MKDQCGKVKLNKNFVAGWILIAIGVSILAGIFGGILGAIMARM